MDAPGDLQAKPALPAPATPSLPAKPNLLEVAFLGAALAALALWARAPAMRTFSLLFGSIVLEALPFMLLGSLVGGLVETFVSRERMTALLPRRRWLAVFVAAGMGMLFPVCECAIVPVVRRLARKGLPASAAIAYLLGAPVVNPIVATSTAVAYRFSWPVVAGRALIGYAIAVGLGLLAGWLFRGREIFHDSVRDPEPSTCHAGCGHAHAPTTHADRPPLWRRLTESLRHGADDFLGVGHLFVIGAFIAALAQTFVDRNLLLRVSSQPLSAILLMMLLAVALNLCSEADAFVASSFRGLMPLSAQMAFLLLGPILDLKLLLMYQTLFRRRVIVTLALAMFGTVLAVALALQASGRFSP
jgi:hypothetical protein